MAHNGDDGVAGHEVLGTVLLLDLVDGVDHILRGEAHLEAELVGDELDGLGVESLVDADEDADRHAGGDNLGHRHVHHGGQLVGGDELRHLQHVLLLHLVLELLFHLGVHLLALLAVVLGGLRFAEGREAGQRVADLLLDLVVVYLDGLLFLFLFLLLAGTLLLLGSVLLALLLGLFLLLVLLLGHLGTDLLHLGGADGLLLGVLALALAAGGVGAVLAELAEVDLVKHLGAFELGVLCLYELRLGFGLRFCGFDCRGFRYRLWCRCRLGSWCIFLDGLRWLFLLLFLDLFLLVGTGALVDGAEVNLAHHIEGTIGRAGSFRGFLWSRHGCGNYRFLWSRCLFNLLCWNLLCGRGSRFGS